MNNQVLTLLTLTLVLSLCGGCKQKQQQVIPDPLYEVGDRIYVGPPIREEGTITRILHYSPEEFGWYYDVKFDEDAHREYAGTIRPIDERSIRREKPKPATDSVKPSLDPG